jgi:hypothetical protein
MAGSGAGLVGGALAAGGRVCQHRPARSLHPGRGGRTRLPPRGPRVGPFQATRDQSCSALFVALLGRPRPASGEKLWGVRLEHAEVVGALQQHANLGVREPESSVDVAALAVAAGASTRELMVRMGHSSSAAALRYQHVMAGRDAAIAAALDELIQAASARSEDSAAAGSGTRVARTGQHRRKGERR